MAPILLTLWQWRRALIYGAFVLIVAAFLWRVSVWHDAYERLGSVEGALEAERLCGEGSACEARQAALEAAHVATNAKVVATYEQELADIRGRPARVVRVCPAPGDVQGARAARGADAGTAAAGELPGQAGRDLGPELYGLAREADEIVARCRALQNWNRDLAR